jgi:hypothetical protein
LRAPPPGARSRLRTGHANLLFNSRLRARVRISRIGIHLDVTSIARSTQAARSGRVEAQAKESAMTVKITPNDKGNPPGKVAEAELHFTEGPLDGLKLIGFSIWEQRGGVGGYNVTFPARQYTVNGDRRSFALLRPIVDTTAQDKVRELILQAFQEFEERASIAS